jgi:hypothetical protein
VRAPIFPYLLFLGFVGCAAPASHSPQRAPTAAVASPSLGAVPPASCLTASGEIALLVEADQTDRRRQPTPPDWPRIRAADLQRRTRVSELSAAGCLSTAADYAASALIFQHGDAPEQYKQAFVFASRAVALGDTSQKDLMALATDRYLVSTRHKQLFASQFSRRDGDPCWCLHQVEPTFPDDQRVAYVGKTLKEERDRLRTMNASTSTCTRIECDEDLAPTPRGSVPGMW